MTPAARPERITVEEYLRAEWASEERHVYLDGRVFAMAGESDAHGDISANVVGLLHAQLRGKPCRVKTKDTKVRSGPPGPRPLRDAAGMYSYPDAVVVCGQAEFFPDRSAVLTNPTAIVEVLSPSTEAFDRDEKFARYERWNPTLTDYVLVAQDRPRVEHYTRQPGGKWLFSRHDGLDATVDIPAIGCALKLADVYDRIEFPAPDPGDG